MPLVSRKNQYIGINAHFQSFAQNRYSGWTEFHSAFINQLADTLDQKLPDNYIVRAEPSMQIRKMMPPTDESSAKPATVEPDVGIFYTGQQNTGTTAELLTPTFVFPAVEIIDDPDLYFRALTVRTLTEGIQGDPVVWLELLSPTNKPGGGGHRQYIEKRRATLDAGIVLVEIDFLHETLPVDDQIPDYLRREEKSYPFMLLLTDPRPELSRAETRVYGFRVEQPVPRLKVPLANQDMIAIDFDEVYQQTYTKRRAFSADVDYSQPPVNFDHYDEIDQVRILARMQAVTAASASGASLEDAPFPIITAPGS